MSDDLDETGRDGIGESPMTLSYSEIFPFPLLWESGQQSIQRILPSPGSGDFRRAGPEYAVRKRRNRPFEMTLRVDLNITSVRGFG
jgi:hypothetical protein